LVNKQNPRQRGLRERERERERQNEKERERADERRRREGLREMEIKKKTYSFEVSGLYFTLNNFSTAQLSL
jgi:RNA-binding protein 25